MRITLYSDLHMEFMGDPGWRVFVDMTPIDTDVVVLAGDITSNHRLAPPLPEVLRTICARHEHVVYVPGNHEYYDASPKQIDAYRDACAAIKNLSWLDDSAVTIDGQRFIGGTLWFPDPATAHAGMYGTSDLRNHMADFHHIREFEPWVYRKADATRTYLAKNVEAGDIVVTHHLPSFACVAERHLNSALNRYFVHNCESVIEERKPRAWMFGHTHESVDYTMGSTRLLCNPFGYAGHEMNENFRMTCDLVVDP